MNRFDSLDLPIGLVDAVGAVLHLNPCLASLVGLGPGVPPFPALGHLFETASGPAWAPGSGPLEGSLSTPDGAIPVRAWSRPLDDRPELHWIRFEDRRPALDQDRMAGRLAQGCAAADLVSTLLHDVNNRLALALALADSGDDAAPPASSDARKLQGALEAAIRAVRSLCEIIRTANERQRLVPLGDAIREGIRLATASAPVRVPRQLDLAALETRAVLVPANLALGLAAWFRATAPGPARPGATEAGRVAVRTEGATTLLELRTEVGPGAGHERLAAAGRAILGAVARAAGGDLAGRDEGPGGMILELRLRHDPAETPHPPARPPARPAGPLAGKRILVVDQDRDFLRIMGEKLREMGAESSTGTSDPREALACIRATPLDLVLCSPDLVGAEVGGLRTEALRLRPELAPRFLVPGEAGTPPDPVGLVRVAASLLSRPPARPS